MVARDPPERHIPQGLNRYSWTQGGGFSSVCNGLCVAVECPLHRKTGVNKTHLRCGSVVPAITILLHHPLIHSMRSSTSPIADRAAPLDSTSSFRDVPVHRTKESAGEVHNRRNHDTISDTVASADSNLAGDSPPAGDAIPWAGNTDTPAGGTGPAMALRSERQLRSASSHNAPLPSSAAKRTETTVALMEPGVLFTPPPFLPTVTASTLPETALDATANNTDRNRGREFGVECRPMGDGVAHDRVPSLSVSTGSGQEGVETRQAVVHLADASVGLLAELNDLMDQGWRLQRMDVEEGEIVRIHLIHRG